MNRIKVVIVDDEYLIRELLQEKIDWNTLNCEIVLKASSASEVYDFIDEDENDVDLILTDINMPFIDGLQMAKKIRIDYPKIKFIVITGYDEFQFAKKGIDIGVEGFILKPINKTEVEDVIRKTTQVIEQELKQEVEHKRLIQRIKDEEPFLKEKFFFDHIEHNVNYENMLDQSDNFGINKDGGYFQIGLINLQDDHDNKEMTFQQCRILLEDYFSLVEGVHVFVRVSKSIYILNTNNHIHLVDELKYCSRIVKESLGLDLIIGLSKVKNDIKDLAEAANEVKICMKYREQKDKGSILSYDEISILNEEELDFSKEEFYINELLESFQFYIKAGLVNEVFETIDKLFLSYKKFVLYKKSVSDVFLKVQLARVVTTVQYTIITMGNGIYEELSQDKRYIEISDTTKLYTIDSMATGKEWIKEFCSLTLEYVNRKLLKKDENIIDLVDDYIVKNLSDSSLSLKGTAGNFYMNSSYLSRIYKKQVGESFKERVFNLRMEKAVEILKTTNKKVYEVGNQVGIDDPNYFSLCFKRYMNMSVSEFRKKLANNMK